ncbi:hypothetical protein ABWW58_16155 [Sporolactobacillus sp. STCC-11]|uniref:hypothetical protein n=1 Tax=Sporolactobacillus caesalpiniae TaxID=3230362 RepID=UPI003398EA4C
MTEGIDQMTQMIGTADESTERWQPQPSSNLLRAHDSITDFYTGHMNQEVCKVKPTWKKATRKDLASETI